MDQKLIRLYVSRNGKIQGTAIHFQIQHTEKKSYSQGGMEVKNKAHVQIWPGNWKARSRDSLQKWNINVIMWKVLKFNRFSTYNECLLTGWSTLQDTRYAHSTFNKLCLRAWGQRGTDGSNTEEVDLKPPKIRCANCFANDNCIRESTVRVHKTQPKRLGCLAGLPAHTFRALPFIKLRFKKWLYFVHIYTILYNPFLQTGSE